jgi:hypothetical protein
MPIGNLMSPIALSVALIAVLAGAAVALFAYLKSRVRFVDFYKTYAIRAHGGLRRFPTRITWLKTLSFDNHEYIVKGRRNAARFEFLTRNRDEAGAWTVKKLQLMNRSTGAIDLRVHTMEVIPFKVASADHHNMEIHATIEFQLDRRRLFRCFQYANLGDALLTRLEGFIRGQINSRQNQAVAREITKIRDTILEEMREAEETDNEKHKAWGEKNGKGVLQNTYFRETPSMALGIHITNFSLQVEQVDTPVGVQAQAGGQQLSALMIPPQHLDDLRDMFESGREEKTTEANEALLRTMEMHTRENIARLAASSPGKMIIISSDDLGLARTSVFRSHIRAGESAGSGDAAAPQDGEGAKNSGQPKKPGH